MCSGHGLLMMSYVQQACMFMSKFSTQVSKSGFTSLESNPERLEKKG